jgi:hypothetical protein
VEPEDHAAADVGPGVFDGRTETRKVNQWSVLSVVGVGVVDPRRRHVVELLTRAGRGLGDVDDLQDLETAEAGDLHGSHAVRLGQGPVQFPVTGRAMLCGPSLRPGRGPNKVLEACDDGRAPRSGG